MNPRRDYVEHILRAAQGALSVYRVAGSKAPPDAERKAKTETFLEIKEGMSATTLIALCEAWLKLNGGEDGR